LNLEATVGCNPAAEGVHADMALLEVVHTVEKVVSVELKLFSEVRKLDVRISGRSQQVCECSQPGLFIQERLIEAQTVGSGEDLGTSRGKSSLEFNDADLAVIVAIKSGNHVFGDLLIDTEFGKKLVELNGANLAIAICVQELEGFGDREGVVREKNFLKTF